MSRQHSSLGSTSRGLPQRPRRARRLAAGVLGTLGALGLLLTSAAAASAHVSVHADTTTAGAESAELTFRVPTESDSADTVSVEVGLPTAHPLAEVLARPIAGWSITVTTGKLPKPVVIDGTTFTEAPLTVTWKATSPDAAVKPGQYQDFAMSAGPLPDSGDVTFTAKQTYSDGTVVTWDQPTVEGQDEPEHPAPSFTITPATNATHHTSDDTARWLSGAGLVVGLIALGGLAAQTLRAGRTKR